MRIKLLAAIAGFLLTSVAMSSCLGGETEVEYTSNAVIQSFAIDTILGETYTFTIDQLNGKIYNQDSLPVGSDTIINNILITDMTVSGLMSIRNYNDTQDSLFTISDSVNLAGTMEKPFIVKVWSPNMEVTRTYSIEVRVHQQHPDSLNWGSGAIATGFAPAITGKQKAALLNERIYVYAPGQNVYSTATSDGRTWASEPVSGLPSTDVTSIAAFQGKLYATVEGSTKAYCSLDGINWSDAALGDNVVRVISPIGEVLTGITSSNGVNMFATTDGSTWTVGEEVPSDFPINNMCATTFKNGTNIETLMVVGSMTSPTETDTATIAWGYMVGQQWAEIKTDSKYKCPLLDTPSIIYYGGSLYTFGSDFTTFYNSVAGLVWNSVDTRFMLPETIRGEQSDYSMVVDDDNFIWIMRSTPNEVWRGRLNRLGFLIQE